MVGRRYNPKKGGIPPGSKGLFYVMSAKMVDLIFQRLKFDRDQGSALKRSIIVSNIFPRGFPVQGCLPPRKTNGWNLILFSPPFEK